MVVMLYRLRLLLVVLLLDEEWCPLLLFATFFSFEGDSFADYKK
jgi:hypothetical protein